MTIAAGFVCDDGIVVCADTQYSNHTDKTSRTKLWLSQRGDCVIAAAGDEVLMKEAAETILAQIDPEIVLDEVKEIIERTMEALHVQHIDASPDQDHTVRVLVAVNAVDGSALFQQSRSAVTSVRRSTCIGSGAAFGNYVVERFWDESGHTVITGCIVAAHLLQLAKRYDTWCGRDSEIVVLPRLGNAYALSKRNIQNVEQFFDSVDAVLRPLLLVIPDPQHPADAVEERLQRFCEGIRATRPFPFDITIALSGVATLGLTGTGTLSTVKIEPVKPQEEPRDDAEPS